MCLVLRGFLESKKCKFEIATNLLALLTWKISVEVTVISSGGRDYMAIRFIGKRFDMRPISRFGKVYVSAALEKPRNVDHHLAPTST